MISTSQGPNLNRSANPAARFVFRYVVDNGNTKLSRAGQNNIWTPAS